ncbi:hypothetical protein [Winogradskyella sp. R77965]|uniref:hypothetical protein n=1 Tax=Winogradskyella sp. R77965 TaxID=3093872 RepID=UPI0037DC0247
MKYLITLIFVFGILSFGFCQKNSVYAEFLGNGIIGSINYERQLTKEPKISTRVGIGLWYNLGILGSSDAGHTIPISVHYLLDLNKNNYLDFGIGTTFVQTKSNYSSKYISYLFTNVGFRRYFGNNWFFKVHVSPYVDNINSTTSKIGGETIYINQEFDFNTKQWFGLSFGKRF